MLESRDQGKPFINAKMIDVPGSAQVRFQNDAFTMLSDWLGANDRLASFESNESISDISQISLHRPKWTDRITKKLTLVFCRVQEFIFNNRRVLFRRDNRYRTDT